MRVEVEDAPCVPGKGFQQVQAALERADDVQINASSHSCGSHGSFLIEGLGIRIWLMLQDRNLEAKCFTIFLAYALPEAICAAL